MGGYIELRLIRAGHAIHSEYPDVTTGRSDWSELTRTGQEQALQIGTAWRKERFQPDEAHSSPLKRAYDTMTLVLQGAGVDLGVLRRDALAEQCLGSHEDLDCTLPHAGKALKAMRESIEIEGAGYVHPGENIEDIPGESIMQVARRMVEYAVDLRGDKRHLQQVAAVTHERALKSMFGYLELGGFVRDAKEIDPLELHEKVRNYRDIDACTQSIIIIEGAAPDDVNIYVQSVGQSLAA